MILMGANLIIPALWLIFSSAALVIYTNYRYEADMHAFLDIRDQMLEAAYIKPVLEGKSDAIRITEKKKKAIQNIANQAEENPEVMDGIWFQHPTIADAMATLNPNLQNLGKRPMEREPQTTT